ncbi:unnamed protein product, partial [Pocillopora meandrina]
ISYSFPLRSRRSQVYLLRFGSQEIAVYCHMGSVGCGDGGWTLAMKIDGTKVKYICSTNKNTFNLIGAKTGFDLQETKLPTYWNTYLSKICLGMRIGHQNRFMIINRHANSLYSPIAHGKYRGTSLGRYTWRRLIGSDASLQRNCNREGFNARASAGYYKARIGIISNNENDCSSCNSRIAFGTGGSNDDSNTCGNEVIAAADNGDKHILQRH